MNEDVIIPEWLHDIFLGYGDPGAAHYSQVDSPWKLATVDFQVRAEGTFA